MERSDIEDHLIPSYEIDLKYEFSAPMFYDFSKGETETESKESEAWLEKAPSDPPTPIYLGKTRKIRSFSLTKESKRWFDDLISKQGDVWIESENDYHKRKMLFKDKTISKKFKTLNS